MKFTFAAHDEAVTEQHDTPESEEADNEVEVDIEVEESDETNDEA